MLIMNRIAKIFFLNFLFASSLFAQTEELGLCSFYSDLFQGKPTASGELYDKNKLTAAHKTLPFGTVVKVTRLDNKKSVQVKVNDRGPFISGRVLEVSREAAVRLGLEKDGSAKVKVEVISEKAAESVAKAPTAEAKPESYEEKPKPNEKAAAEKKAAPAAKSKDANKSKDAKPAPAEELTEKGGRAKAKTAEKAKAPKAVLVKGKDYQSFDLYKIELKRPEKKGFGVQLASYNSHDALLKKIADLQGDWFDNILVSIEQGSKKEVNYKVILGPFTTETEAKNYKANLKKNKKIEGFVVNLSKLTEDK